MSQFFQIHPDNPQPRLIRQAADIIRKGGVVVYPTDSAYALGCHIGDKNALDRIRRIRKLEDRHNFTLVCRDLSEIASYAKVNKYQIGACFVSGAPDEYYPANGWIGEVLHYNQVLTLEEREAVRNYLMAK